MLQTLYLKLYKNPILTRMFSYKFWDSGFEEIVYQPNFCTSRSLLLGKHYIWCCWIHWNFIEALERLFIKKFFPEHSDTIQKLGLVEYPVDVEQLLNDINAIRYTIKYEEVKQKRGVWLKYVEIVETL